MVKVRKRKKKISIKDLLGLDPQDPADQAFVKFNKILVELKNLMLEKKISQSELAKRMKISRQAVHNKFIGGNLTMDWIQRACKALGVEMVITFVDKKKAA